MIVASTNPTPPSFIKPKNANNVMSAAYGWSTCTVSDCDSGTFPSSFPFRHVLRGSTAVPSALQVRVPLGSQRRKILEL